MKQLFFLLIALTGFIHTLTAQDGNIIDDINRTKPGQGNVVVYQDESIEGLIGNKSSNTVSNAVSGKDIFSGGNESPASGTTNSGQPKNYIQTRGFKIQVFSGNDQKKSKTEAQHKKALVQNRFPEMEVTVSFNSPVWRVRAGNFKTREQANEALRELKSAFPSFGKEMQIVDSVIKLPVY